MKWNIVVGSLVLGASLCTPSFAGLLDHMLGLRGAGCDSTCCDTGCGAGPSCGCESACGPACGVGPSCGCESACGPACGAGPSCGCESACGPACGAAPSCGCETACAPACDTGCCQPRRRPLHELLCAAKQKKDHLLHRLHHRNNCCDTGCASACEPTCAAVPSCGCESACGAGCGAAPTCGCEVAAPCCDSGCGGHHHGLLHRLFKHRRNNACCDTACDACGVASSCSSCGGGVAAPAASGDAAPMPPAPVVDPSAYLQSNRRVIQATSYVR
jgi:hypothetical protein